MKKIKTICLDKFLAMSSGFIVTSCPRSPDAPLGEVVGPKKFVQTAGESSSPMFHKKNLDGDSTTASTLKYRRFVLPSVENSPFPIDYRELTVAQILFCIKEIQSAVDQAAADSSETVEKVYESIAFYYAYIRSFEDFNYQDNSLIPLYTAAEELQDKACKLISSLNLPPDSKSAICATDFQGKVQIMFGNAKEFFGNLLVDWGAFFSQKGQQINLKARRSESEKSLEKELFMLRVVQCTANNKIVLNLCGAAANNAKRAEEYYFGNDLATQRKTWFCASN
ncbi:MAG: hypothetical protein LBD32_01490, partial [Cytophagales bacterium]|nr:hypothetical protein [Cytophagales bacterium]